jgi:hypothetical protein
MRTKRSIVPALLHALGVLALTASTTVSAGALITYGKTTLGVNDQGHLNFFSDTGPDSSQFGFTYGVYRAGLGDAISPACLCEGWGVSALVGSESFASWASVDTGGVSGLGSGTFGATVNTATSVVDSSVMPMTIRHAFGPSLATDLFQVQVTLTNTSTTETLSDLTYRRAMDWDVPPTEFREFVTHSGVTANLTSNGGNLKYASDDGFAIVDPREAARPIDIGTVNTDFYRSGPADHGSVFDFSFGELAPGASRIFNIYYGSAANEIEAIDKVNKVGASLYSFGNSAPDLVGGGEGEGEGEGEGGGEFPVAAATAGDEEPPAPVNTSINPTTFIFAFGGVSGVEPGTIPELPVLPFVPAPGVFTFDAPTPQRWFDPPSVDGFTYRLESGTFIAVGTPPESFGFDSVMLYIDGVAVGELDPGEVFDFLLAGYTGITTFDLRGISPLVDPTNPVAFPTYLDFTAGATGLSMTAIAAVPEPEQWALMMFGLLFIVAVSRRAARANVRV